MTPLSVCAHLGTSETFLKNHCFPQRTGLSFVVLFVFIDHAKLYPYFYALFMLSLAGFFLLLSAAVFSWVLKVTLSKQDLFMPFSFCSIEGLVAVVCFPWAVPLRCACPEEGPAQFSSHWRRLGSSQNCKHKPRSQLRLFHHLLLRAAPTMAPSHGKGGLG